MVILAQFGVDERGFSLISCLRRWTGGFVLPPGVRQVQDLQWCFVVAARRVAARPRLVKKRAFRHQQQLFDGFWQRLKSWIGGGNRTQRIRIHSFTYYFNTFSFKIQNNQQCPPL